MIKNAKNLVKHGKVKQISPTFFEVENHSVKIQIKRGRNLIICDCQNDTRFCNESPMCVHKISVIIYLATKDFIERMDKLISEYKFCKDSKLSVNIDTMINDLNDIRNKF